MISLKASMRVDEVRALLEKACGAYCGVMRAAQEGVVDLDGLSGEEHRRELMALAARAEDSVEQLRTDQFVQLERELRTSLRHRREQIQQFVKNISEEQQSALTALQDMLGSTAKSSQPLAQATSEITHLRELTIINDLVLIRAGIRQSADRLQNCVEEIRRDQNTAVMMLRDEIRTLQRSIDQLTTATSEVLPRSQFEASVEGVIQSEVFFSIIHISIRNRAHMARFKGDKYADTAVREFATQLTATLPSGTLIGHWNDTEFFVVVRGDHQDGNRRVKEIAALLERTPKSEPHGSQYRLVGNSLAVPFDPQEGRDKLRKKMVALLRGTT